MIRIVDSVKIDETRAHVIHKVTDRKGKKLRYQRGFVSYSVDRRCYDYCLIGEHDTLREAREAINSHALKGRKTSEYASRVLGA